MKCIEVINWTHAGTVSFVKILDNAKSLEV